MLLSFPRIALQCKAPVAFPQVAGAVLTRARSGANMASPLGTSGRRLEPQKPICIYEIRRLRPKNPRPALPVDRRGSPHAEPQDLASGSHARPIAFPFTGEKRALVFTLNTLEDKPVDLKQLTAKKPVVLVVLRGWPGYQCPICTRQVQGFTRKAADFAAHGAQVVMVYPGPADDLTAHAREFLQNKEWPKDFLFVIDPDYTFTNAYGLRWDAKNETAYPSTFIIAAGNKVRFAHVSKQHGDRVDSTEALKALMDVK